jgi:hypothetical protein
LQSSFQRALSSPKRIEIQKGAKMKSKLISTATIFLGISLLQSAAMAETYYLERAKTQGASNLEADKANTLFRDSIIGENPAMLTEKKKDADFVLRPNLIKLGDAYVVKVEKKDKDGRVISLAEGKAPTIEELDKAVHKATMESLHGKMARGPKGERPHPGHPAPPPPPPEAVE